MDKYNTAQEYYADQTGLAKERLMIIRDLIYELVPDAVEGMSYGVSAYGLKPNAKLQDKFMMAGFKKHIGIYPHPFTIEAFSERLKPYKTSKGAIQLPLHMDLDIELVKDMISIITSFSGKLYGIRSRKRKDLIKQVKEVVASPEK